MVKGGGGSERGSQEFVLPMVVSARLNYTGTRRSAWDGRKSRSSAISTENGIAVRHLREERRILCIAGAAEALSAHPGSGCRAPRAAAHRRRVGRRLSLS